MSDICGPEEGAVGEVKVGRLVSSIWGNKVVKMKSSSKKGSGYENLQIRNVEDKDKKEIVRFDETTVEDILTIGKNFKTGLLILHLGRKASFLFCDLGEADVDVEQNHCFTTYD